MVVDNSKAVDLLRQALTENDHLDYKVAFDQNRDVAKRELAKDISAFANSRGGWLFIGVDEQNRRPTAYPGIDQYVGTQYILDWVQNVVSDRITPFIKWEGYVLPSSDIPELQSDRVVLAIQVSHSPTYPHLESKVGRYYVRRDTESKPAREDEIRRMYFEANNVPRLAINPGFVPLLNWRPAIRIYNVGGAPALNVHGRLGFGGQLTEEADLWDSSSDHRPNTVKEVNIPLLLPGQFEAIVAHDAGTDERYALSSANKVLWSGTFEDHASIKYESRQFLDLYHWEMSITSNPRYWPNALSELRKHDLPELGLWSGHLRERLEGYFEEAERRLEQSKPKAKE